MPFCYSQSTMKAQLAPIALGTFAIVLCAHAEEPAAKTIPQLAALKQQYEKELQAATKPVRERYVESLQSLLRSTTQRGDFQSDKVVITYFDSHSDTMFLPLNPKNTKGRSWTGPEITASKLPQ